MTRWLVVGGGSAGCVVAARLSEVESNEVTLVEAGPDHAGARSTDPPGGPVLDHPERLSPEVLVIRRPGVAPQNYVQGFGLGGSSLVNGGIVVGDPATWSQGHALPVDPVADLGPLAAAVIDLDADAAPVSVVRRSGRRVSAAAAYLDPARERENLTVHCDTRVDRVALDGGLAVGVVTEAGDHLDADRVVLCGGAIASPAILIRSGVDTPGVGLGLQDHAGIAISFDLVDPGSAGVAIGATIERPGRQIVVLDRLPDHPDMGALLAGWLAIESEGSVSLPDPDGPPVAELNQLSSTSDIDGLAVVVDEALRLLAEPALAGLVGRRYVDRAGTSPADLGADDAAMRAWLPHHLSGYHHVSASCRIGGPLRADGAVRGYDGLYVADASALPGVPPRNPYVTIVRQAESLVRQWVASAG